MQVMMRINYYHIIGKPKLFKLFKFRQRAEKTVPTQSGFKRFIVFFALLSKYYLLEVKKKMLQLSKTVKQNKENKNFTILIHG